MAADAGVVEGALGAALKEASERKAALNAQVGPRPAIDAEHPWLGLDSFTEETRAYFHGREQEVAELARRVQRKLLTVLFGQSGLGKTSILRAGIVPKLRPEAYCPVYVRIDYAPESPEPAEQIKAAILRATRAQGEWTQAGVAVEGESLWEFLHHRGDVLQDANGKTVVPLLIFDQFEEIFTLGQMDEAGRTRAARFIEDLADLVENRPPRSLEARVDEDDALSERFDFARADYRILIALREDYLPHLEGLKAQMPSITQNRMRLARMTGQQALAAVVKPGGKLVSEEVAESIVRFIAGGSELPNAEVEPSLLSLICRELNNARIAQGRAEISIDLLAGSKETILGEFYERALADQPAAVRRFIEDELLTDSGFRESLAEERVKKAFSAAGAAPFALAQLVDRRLLRVEERLDVRRVELTHDVLCKVVAESRDLRHEREAKEEAERQLAAQRAREMAARNALVRARRIAGGCALLALAAIVSAGFGFYNLDRARAAEAEAERVRVMAERARGEAEKLLGFLVDDFYRELAPVGRAATIESLTQRVLDYYRELPPELRTTDAESNRALALVRQGSVLNVTGRQPQAEENLKQAMAILRERQAKGDRSEALSFALARANSLGAVIAFFRTAYDESIRLHEEALAALKPLTEAPAPPKAYLALEAATQQTLGLAMLRQPRDGAIPVLEASLARFKALVAADERDHNAKVELVWSGAWLAEALSREGRIEDARKVFDEVRPIADSAVVAQPGNRRALRGHATLFRVSTSIESAALRIGPALALARPAERSDGEAFRGDPTNTAALNNYVVAQGTVAWLSLDSGRFEEGISQMRKLNEWVGNPRLFAFIANNLAYYLSDLAYVEANFSEPKRAAKAVSDARTMLAKLAESRARDPRTEAYFLTRVARIHMLAGDFKSAREAAQQAVDLYRGTPMLAGKLAYDFRATVEGPAYVELARAAAGAGDHRAAEEAARKAFEIQQALGGMGPRREAERQTSAIELALAVARQGRNAEAQSIISPAVEYLRRPDVYGSDSVPVKALLARALLVSAIATPRDRTAKLWEAVRIMESLPAGWKGWKTYAQLRAEIAAEASRRP